jgi:hypothetical protein
MTYGSSTFSVLRIHWSRFIKDTFRNMHMDRGPSHIERVRAFAIVKSAQDIIKSGQWWADPWWVAPEIYGDSGLSFEEVRRRIDALKRLFTADWVQLCGRNGPDLN